MTLRAVDDLPDLARALLARYHEDWMDDAACAGRPTNDWFTDEVADRGTDTEFPETVYAALRICARCPVAASCVAEAYEQERDDPDPWLERTDTDNDRYGVWAVPGRIRERFAGEPDRVARCLDWLASIATSPQRRWRAPKSEEGEATA